MQGETKRGVMFIRKGIDWLRGMASSLSRGRLQRLTRIFQTYRTGKLTVVALSKQYRDVPLRIGPAARQELARLIRICRCRVLAFDMSGIQNVPSSLLGLLASVASQVDELQLYNASDAICEALEIHGLEHVLKPVPAVAIAPMPSLSA